MIAGASQVIAVDPVASRRERAHRFGAIPIAPAEGVVANVRALSGGRGPDVALCSIANQTGVNAAFASLRQDGRMVTVVGNPPAGGEERKWVSGHWGCDERLWPQVIEHLRQRRFLLDGYITHTFPLERIEEAFAISERDLEGSFKVIVTPG